MCVLLSLGVLSMLGAITGDTICDLVQRERVECQVHHVETADGYQLTLQRIPPPRNQSCPVLLPFVLMHGLIGSAADYVAAGRRSGALAFRLHAHCYDVWLPNARGTTASRHHRRLAASEAAFWQFSWHEIGVYDMPAVLEHVLRVTQQPRLHYVGHSQGTTVLLVLLAQRPEFNAQIASATLLAPIAYLKHLSSPPLRLLARDLASVMLLLQRLGLHELLAGGSLAQLGSQLVCHAALPTAPLCALLASLYVGFSEHPMDRELFPRILETTPAGISRGQLLHFGQLINSGKFQQYDFHSARLNRLHYGQPSPPLYQLKNVRLNMQLFYGNRDALASRKDVLRLVRDLSNSRLKLYQVRGYNHIDFLYADSAPQIIYEKIIEQARRAN